MTVLVNGALMIVRVIGALLCLAAGGCLEDVPPDGVWVPWDEIEGPLRPEVGQGERPPLPDGAIRVVTFNAALGEDVAALARAMREHRVLRDTDVLLVQEIESHADEPQSRAAALAAALDMSYIYAPARVVGDADTHGLAIFSRYELNRLEVMQLPEFDLRVRSRKRIALAADIAIGGGGLRVIDVHLDTRINITQRIQQLHVAVSGADQRVVVAGDFNTNPYIWAEGILPLTPVQAATAFEQAEAVGDYMRNMGFDTPTEGSGPTHHAAGMDHRLDAVYTRELWALATGVVRGLDLSDHDPLWVDLAWPTGVSPRLPR
jgi:endonuclease/exonuclease/phosphatase family metal-dependent hydrolase